MKSLPLKIKIAALLTGLCLFLLGCFFADFHTYRPQTKTIPQQDGSLIFSLTTFDGKTEAKPFLPCFGHTWLSVENQTDHSVFLCGYEIEPGKVLTFSVWDISHHRGVVFNLEANFIRQYGRYVGRQSLCMPIEEAQLKTVEAYILKNNAWTLGKNCSRWCLLLWNELAEEPFRLPTQTLLYTPSRLQKALREFTNTETDKDFSAAGEIFFYENAVRTEVQLCS